MSLTGSSDGDRQRDGETNLVRIQYVLVYTYFKRAHSGSRPTCVGCGGVVVLLWFAIVYLVYGGMLACWHVGMLENVRFEGLDIEIYASYL